jgi:hypothetical protein
MSSAGMSVLADNGSKESEFNLVFVRGMFKYIDEDENYFYVIPISTIIWEIKNDNLCRQTYLFINEEAKFSKPLMHFGGGVNYWFFIGRCDHWEWIN